MVTVGGDKYADVLVFLAEKRILKPNDVSVFSALSINGRLFACPRDQLNSLVRDGGFITLYSLYALYTCYMFVCVFLNKVRHFYICLPQTPLPDQEGPSAGSMSTFELMSSKDLAYQMTMFDWELFSCMHEVMHTNKGTRRKPVSEAASPKTPPPSSPQHELLYHTFGQQNFRRTTANLDLFLRRFNQVQLWVVTEVCLCGQLSKRVQLLKKFIKIAAQ